MERGSRAGADSPRGMGGYGGNFAEFYGVERIMGKDFSCFH